MRFCISAWLNFFLVTRLCDFIDGRLAYSRMPGAATCPWLQVWREQPRDAVAHLDRQRPRIDLSERVRARLLDARFHHRVEVRAELDAVALDVELEVEAQAACVPVGRAEQEVGAVHHHQLGVVERPGAKVEL